jgi:hypothetical protein
VGLPVRIRRLFHAVFPLTKTGDLASLFYYRGGCIASYVFGTWCAETFGATDNVKPQA